MTKSILGKALVLTAVAFATPAHAVFVEFEFNGTVTNNPGGNPMIRQADGSLAPYTGPVPDYPYKNGDTVNFQFSTLLPSYLALPADQRPPDDDGIYAFTAYNQSGPGPSNVGVGLDVSGPFRSGGDAFNPGGISGLQLYYNANAGIADADRLSISGLGFAILSGPHYLLNSVTGGLGAAELGCSINLPRSCFGAVFRTDGVSINRPSIFSDDLTVVPDILGFADGVEISGSWSLSIFGNQPPTEVPAPPAILFFAAGVGALAWRRRFKIQKRNLVNV